MCAGNVFSLIGSAEHTSSSDDELIRESALREGNTAERLDE